MNQKKKLLLVEDDSELRSFLRDIFFKDYEVLQAEDGEQAIARIVDFQPNLVLLDLLLPKLDGFKVLERLRSYPNPQIANIYVIVLSNLWNQNYLTQAYNLGVKKYFVKSHANIEDIVKEVKKTLG